MLAAPLSARESPEAIAHRRWQNCAVDISGISATTERSYPVISSHATDMANMNGAYVLSPTGGADPNATASLFDAFGARGTLS